MTKIYPLEISNKSLPNISNVTSRRKYIKNKKKTEKEEQNDICKDKTKRVN